MYLSSKKQHIKYALLSDNKKLINFDSCCDVSIYSDISTYIVDKRNIEEILSLSNFIEIRLFNKNLSKFLTCSNFNISFCKKTKSIFLITEKCSFFNDNKIEYLCIFLTNMGWNRLIRYLIKTN